MTERRLLDADKAQLIAAWTSTVESLTSWRHVPAAVELVVREVLGEDPGRISRHVLDDWQPEAIAVKWRARRLTAEARGVLQKAAVLVIASAKTWEAAARGILRVAAAVARAYGGAA